MQINISARHGHLSPATQEKITETVGNVWKFLDRITAMHVTVDLEGLRSGSLNAALRR